MASSSDSTPRRDIYRLNHSASGGTESDIMAFQNDFYQCIKTKNVHSCCDEVSTVECFEAERGQLTSTLPST
jgi:hypothetical protein